MVKNLIIASICLFAACHVAAQAYGTSRTAARCGGAMASEDKAVIPFGEHPVPGITQITAVHPEWTVKMVYGISSKHTVGGYRLLYAGADRLMVNDQWVNLTRVAECRGFGSPYSLRVTIPVD